MSCVVGDTADTANISNLFTLYTYSHQSRDQAHTQRDCTQCISQGTRHAPKGTVHKIISQGTTQTPKGTVHNASVKGLYTMHQSRDKARSKRDCTQCISQGTKHKPKGTVHNASVQKNKKPRDSKENVIPQKEI